MKLVIQYRKGRRILLRHHPELREEDGAVERRELISQIRSHFPEDVSRWGPQEWIDRLQRAGTRQDLSIV